MVCYPCPLLLFNAIKKGKIEAFTYGAPKGSRLSPTGKRGLRDIDFLTLFKIKAQKWSPHRPNRAEKG
jgi:hypothetical protein